VAYRPSAASARSGRWSAACHGITAGTPPSFGVVVVLEVDTGLAAAAKVLLCCRSAAVRVRTAACWAVARRRTAACWRIAAR
jgi:hypothetical protein